MKKFVIAILTALIALALTACGHFYNRAVVDLVWEYDTAIIQRFDGEQEIQVKNWRDYENSDMIQITATDGTVYLTHSSNVILMRD